LAEKELCSTGTIDAMVTNLEAIKKQLRSLGIIEKAQFLPGFFQIGRAGYPQKDKFLGVSVPNCHKIAKEYPNLSFDDMEKLLKSEFHEERLVALFMLVDQFEKGSEELRKIIYDFYLKHTQYIDNWDLVDASSYKIVGQYILDKPHDVLYNLAYSKNIWERRIAIVSTMAFIKKGEFQDTFKISEILVADKHDLIQKAVGWLLREAGKKDKQALVDFLMKNYQNMSRTSLRYAIEKFDQETRKKYLKGDFND
jgi:3-methyladenine DNA glycosylase AlkD